MNGHWGQRDVLEKEGGSRTAGLVAPMLCGEVEDGGGVEEEEEVVSAAPSAYLVTLAAGGQAFHLLAWGWTRKHKRY